MWIYNYLPDVCFSIKQQADIKDRIQSEKTDNQ